MIRKVLILSILFIAVDLSAQQLSTSGQSNLKFYNNAIERLQKMKPGSMGYEEAIMDAKKKIASIKKTDPGYDVSSQEEEIKKYEKGNMAIDQVSGTVINAHDLDKELSSFLTWSFYEFKNSKTDAEYANMSKKVDEQIGLLSEFCKNKLVPAGKDKLNKIEDYWETNGQDETQINSAKNYYQTAEEGNVFSYYQIKWLYNKWKLFSEVYPGSEPISSAVQKANEVLKMIGSADDAKKRGEAAKAKRIAGTKMDPAVVSDPDLEAQIKKAISSSKFAVGKTVIKVNIHSKNWTIQKHAVTGATLSRTKGFSAALKEKDGRCSLLHYVDFKQEYVNGNFEQGYINLGELVEILCENVK